jgi:hypothetical protein
LAPGLSQRVMSELEFREFRGRIISFHSSWEPFGSPGQARKQKQGRLLVWASLLFQAVSGGSDDTRTRDLRINPVIPATETFEEAFILHFAKEHPAPGLLEE